MSESPAPFAAGKHLPWADVPDAVRQWAMAIGGTETDEVRDLAGGFSPGATTLLRFDGGRQIFVKAVGAALNPESPTFHRREGVIAQSLAPSPFWPQLIDVFDDGDWVALAFEAIDGHMPRHPWDPGELERVVRALEEMHRLLTPCLSSEVSPANQRLQAVFGGWGALAAMDQAPPGLDEWSRRHLDRLAAIESDWPEACAGSTLLHFDLRSDNMLLHEGGVAFVDWPHATVGPPVLDLVAWAPSVVLEGGPDPEELLAGHAMAKRADSDVVTVLVAAVSGFLVGRSLQPPPPGLPTLRAFQAAQGEVARAWLARLTGL